MRKKFIVAALIVAGAVASSVVAARQLTLLVLDVPQHQATLLVKRDPALDMRLLDTETSLCRRQRAGSPLHSVMLPATFCPAALVTSSTARGDNVLVSLPFAGWLHQWVD